MIKAAISSYSDCRSQQLVYSKGHCSSSISHLHSLYLEIKMLKRRCLGLEFGADATRHFLFAYNASPVTRDHSSTFLIP